MATLLQLIASLTQWVMLGLGGINASRLSTPDTEASPGDYAAYVGGPLAASAVSWIVRRLTKGMKAPDPAPAAVTPSPLGEFLREVFTAPPGITATPAPPLAPGAAPLAPPPPPADWLHADAGRIVARLTQEGRIDDAERFLGLLKETGHE
jgi:hypothetical protein